MFIKKGGKKTGGRLSSQLSLFNDFHLGQWHWQALTVKPAEGHKAKVIPAGIEPIGVAGVTMGNDKLDTAIVAISYLVQR